LQPEFLEGYAYNTEPSLNIDEVQLIWMADSRTHYFKISEDNMELSTYNFLDETVPGYATIVEKRHDDKTRFYDHLTRVKEDIVYRNRYQVFGIRSKSPGRSSLDKIK
jgi:hypothetical protein